jgi:predicted kinase
MSPRQLLRPPAPPVVERQPKLYVLIGLPAAGKTTLARHMELELRALRFTPDEWMIPLFGESEADGMRNVVEGRCIAVAVSALRLGCNVILDFGVWAKDERTALRWLASTMGAECELIYLDISASEQSDRVHRRFTAAPGSTFPITQSELDHWRTIFQPPSQEELRGNDLDAPPTGFESWRAWVSDWWPTSLS